MYAFGIGIFSIQYFCNLAAQQGSSYQFIYILDTKCMPLVLVFFLYNFSVT